MGVIKTKDFSYAPKCVACPPEFAHIKFREGVTLGDFEDHDDGISGFLESLGGKGLQSVSSLGIPTGAIGSALGAVKGMSNPCGSTSGILAGLLTGLTAFTGVPLFLLNGTLGNMFSCPQGREKLKAALKTCAEKLKGGIFDVFITQPGGPEGMTPRPGLVFHSETELARRRGLFIDRFVELMSIGGDVESCVINSQMEVSGQGYIVTQGMIDQARDSALSPSNTNSPGQIQSSLKMTGNAPKNDVGRKQFVEGMVGYAETIAIFRACINGTIKELAKVLDKQNYDKFASDELKALGELTTKSVTSAKSLLSWFFALSGAVALAVSVKKKKQVAS